VTARWFFNSRARGPRMDYTWRPAGGGEDRPAREIADRGWHGEPFSDLVSSGRPGLLLFDDRKDGAVLLVTGLIPVTRPTDQVGRLIRVTLLGATAAGDQPGMHALLAAAGLALRGELAGSIPVSYGAEDFGIDSAGWSGLVADAATSLAAQAAAAPQPDPASRAELGKSWLLPDADSYRTQVAAQLSWLIPAETRRPLAGRILILRTGILDQAEIARLRPWRVLSGSTDRATAL